MPNYTDRSHSHIHLNFEEIRKLLQHDLPSIERVSLVDSKSGANTHYEIESRRELFILRLYVRSPNAIHKERQIHTLLKDHPFIPQMIASGEGYTLFKKHPGKPLTELSWSNHLSYTLGQTLAAIHQNTFPFSSLCEVGLKPDNSLQKEAYYEEAHRLITQEQLVASRLGSKLADTTYLWLEKKRPLFPKIDARSHLVHSDFRPANLLYHPQKGLCVLDWEFAHVGNPLLDFGILMRYRSHYPLDPKALKCSYTKGGGELLDPWEEMAAAADLVNIFDILSRPAEIPNLFAFLIQALEDSLARYP